MTRIIGIIQARMGSTRFPNKTMMDIMGKPMLWHIINRVSYSNLLNGIGLVTTNRLEDNIIQNFWYASRIALAKDSIRILDLYRGDDHDVLHSFFKITQKTGLSPQDIIVRITADDPLKDPVVMDDIIMNLLMGRTEEKYVLHCNGILSRVSVKSYDLDYVSNTIKPMYPEGIDIEAFKVSALVDAVVNATEDFDKEHVTPYIWRNPDKFKILNLSYHKDLSYMRWTVDYPEDLEFVREVYRYLYKEGEIFLMEDVLELLKEHPEIAEINAHIKQREKYEETLEK